MTAAATAASLVVVFMSADFPTKSLELRPLRTTDTGVA
jgi:hypothetical protein